MKSKGSNKFHRWLEKKLSFPGCTEKQLQGNLTSFENQIFIIFFAGSVAVFCWIFAPYSTLAIQYCTLICTLYTLSLFLQLSFPRRYLAIHAFITATMNLLAFYTVFKLGGIPTSGGLIFVGLSAVMATIPRRKAWLPITMFIIYSVWVILLVVLKPWLHIPDQVNPLVNSIIFAYCAIGLTGAALAFVLRFIRHLPKKGR